MKCFKCGKEMDREDGGTTIKGIVVDVALSIEEVTTGECFADIEYRKLQLGKYSDAAGKCHVAICYECYIDGLFK